MIDYHIFVLFIKLPENKTLFSHPRGLISFQATRFFFFLGGGGYHCGGIIPNNKINFRANSNARVGYFK